MLTVINKIDRTQSIPFSSMKIDQVQGDPIGKFSFVLEDPGSQIQLVSQQEVIVFDENAVLTPNVVVPGAFTDTYLTDASSTASNYTSTNNPSGSPSTWTQNLQTGGGTTPLTTYIANAASSTIGTADKLYVASGTPATVNTLVTCNGSTGWGEIVSQGSSSAWPALGAIGTPSGKGFFMDTTILDGLSIAAGNWSGNVRISANAAGTVSANLTVRVYRYHPGTTTYTLITSWTLNAQAWTTTISTSALPSTSAAAIAFAAGDKLYIDYWANITANTSGTGQQVRMNRLSTDTGGLTGDTNTQIVTPGYGVPVVAGSLTASGGAAALYLLNTWTAQNATVSCTMTLSDFGGMAFNIVNTSNFYELAIRDNSSPTPGLQLFKTVAGNRNVFGSPASVSFVRGTSHTTTVSTSTISGVTTIIVIFDGAQVINLTDNSPLGSGQVGLRNDTGSGASSATYTAFSASSNDVPTLVKSVPSVNYLQNNNFNFASGGWTEAGTLTGRITFPANGTFGVPTFATLTFANQAVGSDTRYQDTIGAGSAALFIVAGQQYCFSATVNVTAAFTNSYAFLQMVFLDAPGNVLATITSPNITATGSQRISVQGTAPTGAYACRAVFGGTTTTTTNSGTATFTSLMIEPMWFPNLYTYPSPICDALQSDCITLPDGTASRFDRIFTGFITHRKASYGGTTRYWEVEATGADGMLENVAQINASYSSTTDQSILTGIVDSLSPRYLFANDTTLTVGRPGVLAYRNVPVCVAGIVVDSIQYADASLREVLNSLMDLSGFLGGVDNYFNVYYYPPFYAIAPYGFSDTPDNVTTFPYHDYSIDYDGTQLQNDIRVVGATFPTSVIESWHFQDGSHVEGIQAGKTINVVLNFLPNAVPILTIGGVGVSCGSDTGTGYGGASALISSSVFGTPKLLSFPSPGYAAGIAIVVSYAYDTLAYVETKAPDSIAKYQRAFYGKINDTNLASNASAVARGEAELEAYSDDRITLTFKTWKLLVPGQIIEFTSALDNLSKAHYVVQKVTAVFLGYNPIIGPINEYQVQAGIYVDDFIDFFRNSQKAINRATHDPAAPIQAYNNLQLDSINFTDSLNIRVVVPVRYKPRVLGGPVPY